MRGGRGLSAWEEAPAYLAGQLETLISIHSAEVPPHLAAFHHIT